MTAEQKGAQNGAICQTVQSIIHYSCLCAADMQHHSKEDPLVLKERSVLLHWEGGGEDHPKLRLLLFSLHSL